ncbi:limonene-1,2-epoxide hydrolase family protein [Streptomyces sp. NPDC047081]|uniref:nuclear transport factor 2 family protein n=1 Tax=Streptomyces sp. NPDC047081 TaxID=3154706 RepID=UPI0033FA1EB2
MSQPRSEWLAEMADNIEKGVEMSAEKVIRSFFMADWTAGGIRATFEEYFAEEVVWRNTGFPDAVGKNAALETLDVFMAAMGAGNIEIEIGNVAANGEVVFTERIDRVYDADGRQLCAPEVLGLLKVSGGQIVYWHDAQDPRPYIETGLGHVILG